MDCLILDNWRNKFKDIDKIATKLRKLLGNKRLILLSHGADFIAVDLATQESHEGFVDLYFREIRRQDLHSIVKSVDANNEIADENIVVERLNQDLVSLNIHRIPYNSIQIVFAYRNLLTIFCNLRWYIGLAILLQIEWL